MTFLWCRQKPRELCAHLNKAKESNAQTVLLLGDYMKQLIESNGQMKAECEAYHEMKSTTTAFGEPLENLTTHGSPEGRLLLISEL